MIGCYIKRQSINFNSPGIFESFIRNKAIFEISCKILTKYSKNPLNCQQISVWIINFEIFSFLIFAIVDSCWNFKIPANGTLSNPSLANGPPFLKISKSQQIFLMNWLSAALLLFAWLVFCATSISQLFSGVEC